MAPLPHLSIRPPGCREVEDDPWVHQALQTILHKVSVRRGDGAPATAPFVDHSAWRSSQTSEPALLLLLYPAWGVEQAETLLLLLYPAWGVEQAETLPLQAEGCAGSRCAGSGLELMAHLPELLARTHARAHTHTL